MEIKKAEIKTFCSVLIRVHKEHGLDKCADLFHKFIKENSTRNILREIEEQVFIEVQYNFGCTKELLRTSNKRKMVPEARAMCAILLHKHINLSHDDISIIFGRMISPSAVTKILKPFRLKLSGYDIVEHIGYNKLFTDEFVKKFHVMDQKITSFKKSLIETNTKKSKN